jgi:hypothetical protein
MKREKKKCTPNAGRETLAAKESVCTNECPKDGHSTVTTNAMSFCILSKG